MKSHFTAALPPLHHLHGVQWVDVRYQALPILRASEPAGNHKPKHKNRGLWT